MFFIVIKQVFLIIFAFLKVKTSLMHRITDYFPDLTSTQQEQFVQLESLYKEWNSKINVISRKDIDELYTRHVNSLLRDCKSSSLSTRQFRVG